MSSAGEQQEAPASSLRAQTILWSSLPGITALPCCLQCPGVAQHPTPVFGSRRPGKKSSTRHDFLLFTVPMYTIPFLTHLTLFTLPRCAGVRAGRPSSGSQWWAAPSSPRRRAVLQFGPASAQMSSGGADSRHRSCGVTLSNILLHLEVQDVQAATQVGRPAAGAGLGAKFLALEATHI
jgi:hypothetical protein